MLSVLIPPQCRLQRRPTALRLAIRENDPDWDALVRPNTLQAMNELAIIIIVSMMMSDDSYR